MYSDNDEEVPQKKETFQTLTLVFTITTLNFLVFPFLHFPLKNASSLGFIEPSDLQYLRRVQPRI